MYEFVSIMKLLNNRAEQNFSSKESNANQKRIIQPKDIINENEWFLAKSLYCSRFNKRVAFIVPVLCAIAAGHFNGSVSMAIFSNVQLHWPFCYIFTEFYVNIFI